jgi:VanZ family protein
MFKMINRYRFSLILSLLILYLSLKNANELNKVQFLNIPNFDKFAHFCMYFTLMSTIFLESRKSVIRRSSVFLITILPFLYGVVMEVLQATLTTTRTASLYDVIFNTLGILASLFIWLLIHSVYKENFR